MNDAVNLQRLKVVGRLLNPLVPKVVFVGGATLSCYADRPTGEIRPTMDVDVVVEMATYSQRVKVEELLRGAGFSPDMHSGIICRYIHQGLTVDVLATTDILGFTNPWYEVGFQESIPYALPDGTEIQILKATHFIATKLVAFRDRGESDGYSSHDFEDIVHVLSSRSTIWEEIEKEPGDAGDFLRSEFRKLAEHPEIRDWLEGAVDRSLPGGAKWLYSKIQALPTP